MAFPVTGQWYLVPHDTLVRIVGETTNALESRSWQENGLYTWPRPPKRLMRSLVAHIVRAV